MSLILDILQMYHQATLTQLRAVDSILSNKIKIKSFIVNYSIGIRNN